MKERHQRTLREIVDEARPHIDKGTRSSPDHLAFVAQQRRNLAREIQRSFGLGLGVTREDVTTLHRLADCAEHEAALAAWRDKPDNQRAEQLHDLDPSDERALALVKTKPRFLVTRDEKTVALDAPLPEPPWPDGCPEISASNPIAWDQAVWMFLRARKVSK